MHVQHYNTVDFVQKWHKPLCQNAESRTKQFYTGMFPEYSLQVTLDQCNVYKLGTTLTMT